jgi:hypothetical protein
LIGLQEQLFEKDRIRDRRQRLRPLGWLLLFILLLFLLALCGAMTRWVTHNVSQLPVTPTTPRLADASNLPLPIPSPSAPLCASIPITWTVAPRQDDSSGNTYQAPPDIQKWVLADYLRARAWAEQNKFNLQVLHAHLPDYFTEEALNQASVELDDLSQTHTFISAGSIQLLSQRREVAFDASGKRATISSYLAASTNVQYDIASRRRIGDGDQLPNRLVVEDVQYDSCGGRWKIARSRVVIDLTTGGVMWGQR